MKPEVGTLPPTAKEAEAAGAMKSLNVGATSICGGKRLLGMVTDRDLVVRVMVEHCNPQTG